jgi:excisionase family DNA binding protein
MTEVQSRHDTEPLTMTVEEAAKALGIGKNQAYAAVARGELPALKIGRRILVSRQQLHAMLNGGDAT